MLKPGVEWSHRVESWSGVVFIVVIGVISEVLKGQNWGYQM